MGIFDRLRRRQRERPAEDDAPGLFTARSGAVPPELDRSAREGGVETEDLWDRPEPEPSPEPAPEVEAAPDVEPRAEPAPDPAVEALSALDPEPPAPADHVEHTTVAAAAPEPAWDESTWEDDEAADAGARAEVPAELPGEGGSTADQPLFSGYEEAPTPPPPFDPVPPLFEPPAVAAEPEPADLVPDVAPGSAPDPDLAPAPEQPDLVVETHPEVIAPEEPDTGPGPVSAGPGPLPREESAAEAADRTLRVHEERLDKRPGPIQMTPSEAIRLAQHGPRAARRHDPPGP